MLPFGGGSHVAAAPPFFTAADIMKVRITTAIAGAAFNYAAGDIVELPDADAAKLVTVGYATPVKASKPKAEKATTPDSVELEVTTDPNA